MIPILLQIFLEISFFNNDTIFKFKNSKQQLQGLDFIKKNKLNILYKYEKTH